MGTSTNLTIALVMGGLGMSACSSGPSLSANQKRGKQIYEALCDKCHELINPTKHNDQAWAAAAKKYGGQLKLTSAEIETLTDYLTHVNDVNN